MRRKAKLTSHGSMCRGHCTATANELVMTQDELNVIDICKTCSIRTPSAFSRGWAEARFGAHTQLTEDKLKVLLTTKGDSWADTLTHLRTVARKFGYASVGIGAE